MRKKVLLMGKSGSGKTSMRSIIFANFIARDTRRLGATIDVEHSHVRFLNLVLNLWDCGGQEAFMENYFASQRDNIFKSVAVLIYVFDVESRELDKDIHYYQSCLEALWEHSREAKIFCLIHKMDLVQEDQRDTVFQKRQAELQELSKPLDCLCFPTSIWDETLYKAWSSIVYKLIPNVSQLEQNLNRLAEIIEADEVLLFERATFLVISHCQRKEHKDVHRFEKISNIIKQFKLSCSKLHTQFHSMEVRNSSFAAFVDVFTPSTYAMVILSDTTIPSAVTILNIKNARKHFEMLEKLDQQTMALVTVIKMLNVDSLTTLQIIHETISSMNYVQDVLVVVGLYYATKNLISATSRCWSVLRTYLIPRLTSPRDFSLVFGGKWAVVTGGSEGIGKAYAMKLAERKLNIVLISRNIEKLQQTAKEIQSKYNVQTKCISVDLNKLCEQEEYNKLDCELSSLDICVLVNNVGMMYEHLQYFLTVPIERQLQIIRLNITTTVLMTDLLLPKFVKKGRGAVVNLGSISSVHPTPLMALYSCCKSFVDDFTRVLDYEYSDQGVTFQVIQPSYVSTNMTKHATTNFFMSSPEQYVESAIRTLGRSSRCFGHSSHALFGYVGELMSERLYMFSSLYIHPILYRQLVGGTVTTEKKYS